MLTPQDEKTAIRNLKSRPKAIELMCKRCVYFPELKETMRQQVENNCPDMKCPLFNFRPCVGGEARKTGNARRIDSKPLTLLE